MESITLGKRIRKARENKKLTQRQLADLIGAKHNSISNWENDQNKPDPDTLELLCGALDVDANWLLPKSAKGFNLTLDEESLIEKFRMLDSYGKLAIKNIIDVEYERCTSCTLDKYDYESSSALTNIAEVPINYETTNKVKVLGNVAAGLPIEAIEDIEIVNIPMPPHGTDFALRTQGDSMEPLIKNGSLIFVHRQADLENGEIGIAMYNGEATCKKVYKKDGVVELHSLNPKYAPMIVKCEDFKVLGKVVF